MVLSCLPGASLSNGIQSVLGSRPWRPPQDLPRTGPFAIELVLKVRQNPAPFQNRDSIGNPVLQVSLVPPWCLPVCPNGSFLPPWCLAGCPIDPFLPPWCLQAVQLILSCLPGASQAVQMAFPASLVPPWCLADCPIDPFLPPWCLASCQMVVLKVKQNPAPFQNRDSIGNPVLQVSLVPPRLSKWLFPASLVPPGLSN